MGDPDALESHRGDCVIGPPPRRPKKHPEPGVKTSTKITLDIIYSLSFGFALGAITIGFYVWRFMIVPPIVCPRCRLPVTEARE